jgi:hypothetical protein
MSTRPRLLCLSVLLLTPLVALAADPDGWFPFQPREDYTPSVIDCSDWLDAPAGKHGFAQVRGKDLAFEDGTPVKFWGVNICNARPAAERETAIRWSRKLAKFGVNCVRFHKFTYSGRSGLGSSADSTRLDPAKLAKMDFFVAELAKRGVYTGWSAIYGHKLVEGDRAKVLAYNEVSRRSTSGLVNFAEDLQDIHIALIVNLLNHRNPHTGRRYADDPSLAFIELQNEDDIFAGGTFGALKRSPTYKRVLSEMFCRWLTERYGSEAKLLETWGEGAMDAFPDQQKGESLAKANLAVIPHYWWYSPDGLKNQGPRLRRRLLDTALFLHETQNAFYGRFAEAIRATGYKGAIVGSCWQAGSGVPHYYNLYSDALAGIVDRHNYSGGGTGHRLARGKVKTAATVGKVGSGILGSGFQQVLDRPFSLSEWICCIPNEWVAEGPPLVAAYGMGLQGWDASFSFGSNYDHYTPTIEAPWVYNVDSPTQIGQYPTLARMIYRGDLAEGDVVAVRRVCVPALAEGELGFSETVQHEGDVKTFSGDVPPEALAAGRVAVEFTEEPQPTQPADLSKYTRDGVVHSATGQLAWRADGKRGCFTIDTPGTKGVVGFTDGQEFRLGNVTIRTETPFAVILITSLDKDQPIETASGLLISAIARARNSGMAYNADRTQVTAKGQAPILLEPVKAAIRIERPGTATVRVLDHDGARTDRTIPVTDGAFEIDANQTPTIYYEVRYE